MKKLLLLISSAIVYGLFSMTISQAYAKNKDLVLIYTGETHAMLYPCSCPIEPDGGVARRATLIKQLREKYPDSLVLDSGNFFSAGLLDQNTLGLQIDMQRARISLGSMELMQYDALAIGDDEFNFGKDFLSENIGKAKLNFLSSNLSLDKIVPYVVKEVAGIKVGIIGLTNLSAKHKAPDLKFSEPRVAVETSVQALKKKGATVIILLSNAGEPEDLKIIENVPGIDVVIDGHTRGKDGLFTKVGDKVILRPAWQGRRISKAVLSVKASNKVGNVSVEELRASDQVSDDSSILSILPRCFVDNDCKGEGLVGSCQNAGNTNASCLFSEANKANLTVINSKECSICNPQPVIDFFKKQFPGLVVTYIDYPDKKSVKLIEDLKIIGLPAYLLGKEVAKEKNFDNLKSGLEEKADFYMLRPETSGLSYFLNRKKVAGKLDLFISLFDKNSPGVLDVIKEFNPAIHFLVIVADDKISVPAGDPEIEEDLRSVCVQKYNPQAFWAYIGCRVKNINSSWWEDCAVNMDLSKIKSCARGPEGSELLKENSSLPRELKVMFGPTYLLDNQSIFAAKETPSKEELKKIIRNKLF